MENHCINCGAVYSEVDTFCAACGSVLTTIANGAALTGPQEPLFLYISVTRLILMSIASFGLYEAYWIYKNWKYINERKGLGLHPFWRGFFGLFFCHSLLKEIKEDEGARALIEPSFSVQLATGWVILTIMANLLARLGPGLVLGIIAFLLPTYLFLVPVQNYINSVTEKRAPGARYYRWSAGHFVCLVWGLIFWSLLFLFFA